MSERNLPVEERLATMRRDFDRAFAEPAVVAEEGRETLLRLDVGGAVYAARLGEIDGLFADRAVVPVPSPLAELLGLAGIRGRLVPVYSLAALLGAAPARKPRWFVVAAGGEVALAFDGMSGYSRARADEFLPSEAGASSLCPHTLRFDDATLSVVRIPSIVEAITSRVRQRRQRPGA